MAGLSELFGNGVVHFKGMDIVLGHPTQEEQGRFSRLLERRAMLFVERVDDEAEKAEYRRAAIRDSAAFEFEWGSDAYTKAIGTPGGQVELQLIVLPRLNPGLPITRQLVTDLVAKKIVEIAAVLRAAEEPDPAKKAAILAVAGLPPDYLDSRNGGSGDSSPPSPTGEGAGPSSTSPG